MTSKVEWFDFQETLCSYFISLGLDAETNKTISGIRTEHDIDVFVQTKFLGQDVKWIVEAKYWETNINKEKVLALRTIVEDIGADRGFIISKVGFQRGAYEAAVNTNIQLLTFEELKELTKEYVNDEILKYYEERVKLIDRRYWSHSKRIRIEYELRHDHGELWYSIPFILATTLKAIKQAKEKQFPINLETHLQEKHGPLLVNNFQQLLNWMNLNLNVADRKILDAERKMQLEGKFNPVFSNYERTSLKSKD